MALPGNCPVKQSSTWNLLRKKKLGQVSLHAQMAAPCWGAGQVRSACTPKWKPRVGAQVRSGQLACPDGSPVLGRKQPYTKNITCPQWRPRIGSRTLLVNLTGNVAVHQHVGMTFWQIFLQSSSTMTTGGMLHAKLPRGSPLRDLMYSSAEPTLVCRVVSPRVLYRTSLWLGRAKVKVNEGHELWFETMPGFSRCFVSITELFPETKNTYPLIPSKDGKLKKILL